ncbi:MAG: MarC family protein [Parashewanella sp.]
MLDINEYVKLTISLFAITVPVAAAAVYLGLTKDYSDSDKKKTIFATATMYFCILTLFTFFGENVLGFFSISINAFKIAGGIILFTSALQLVNSKKDKVKNADSEHSSSPLGIAIVPLGMPLLVGPGNISTIVIYTHMHPSLEHELFMTGVILTNTVFILAIFSLIKRFGKILNEHVTNIINRLMGLIIAAMGVEFVLAGSISHVLEHLPSL